MNNLEELKKCRVVHFLKGNYLVNSDGNKFIHLSLGYELDARDEDYENVDYAYKTYNDFLNGKPYYSKNRVLLSDATKEWLKYVVRSLINVNLDSFRLVMFSSYTKILFIDINGELDDFVLPKNKHLLYNFSKLEKGKEYTFKELGIKL